MSSKESSTILIYEICNSSFDMYIHYSVLIVLSSHYMLRPLKSTKLKQNSL